MVIRCAHQRVSCVFSQETGRVTLARGTVRSGAELDPIGGTAPSYRGRGSVVGAGCAGDRPGGGGGGHFDRGQSSIRSGQSSIRSGQSSIRSGAELDPIGGTAPSYRGDLPGRDLLLTAKTANPPEWRPSANLAVFVRGGERPAPSSPEGAPIAAARAKATGGRGSSRTHRRRRPAGWPVSMSRGRSRTPGRCLRSRPCRKVCERSGSRIRHRGSPGRGSAVGAPATPDSWDRTRSAQRPGT